MELLNKQPLIWIWTSTNDAKLEKITQTCKLVIQELTWIQEFRSDVLKPTLSAAQKHRNFISNTNLQRGIMIWRPIDFAIKG